MFKFEYLYKNNCIFYMERILKSYRADYNLIYYKMNFAEEVKNKYIDTLLGIEAYLIILLNYESLLKRYGPKKNETQKSSKYINNFMNARVPSQVAIFFIRTMIHNKYNERDKDEFKKMKKYLFAIKLQQIGIYNALLNENSRNIRDTYTSIYCKTNYLLKLALKPYPNTYKYFKENSKTDTPVCLYDEFTS